MHLSLKMLSGMANSEDPDQTAPSGHQHQLHVFSVWCLRSSLIWVALFAYGILSETLVFKILRHCILFFNTKGLSKTVTDDILILSSFFLRKVRVGISCKWMDGWIFCL